MNFVQTFLRGKEGKNFGWTTGLKPLDLAIKKIQQGTMYGIAAPPKVGKTTLVDFSFVISPYLEALELNKLDDIDWIYYSYEVGRIRKEYKFAAFFMAHDFGVYNYYYKDKLYPMNMDYLMGKELHEDKDGRLTVIPVQPEHEKMLQEIYKNRIKPLFGEYNHKNVKIKKGKIDFIEKRDNPTGMDKYINNYAKENGEFAEEDYFTLGDNNERIKRKRRTGYNPKNPDKFTIIITDHVRKLKRERGFTLKENIDKWLEYSVEWRNLCNFTFVQVCHSNRQLANTERLKYAGEWVFPTGDDVKDSGNLAEECNILLTLFNPNDEKYNLKRHFDIELESYPNYRSVHIAEARDVECPVHIQTNMYGNVNMFSSLSET